MRTINLVGRITRDFGLTTSPKGVVYAKFGLAVNDGFGKNQKELYFECTAFGVEAERIVKAKAKKGSLIHVTGKFGVFDYTRTDNGEKDYTLTATVLSWGYIPIAGGKTANGESNGGNAPATPPSDNDPPSENDTHEILNLDEDDDLPF